MAIKSIIILSFLAVCVFSQLPKPGMYFRPNWYGSCDAVIQLSTNADGSMSAVFTNGILKGSPAFSINVTGIGYANLYSVAPQKPCNAVVSLNLTVFAVNALQLDYGTFVGNKYCSALKNPSTGYAYPASNPCTTLEEEFDPIVHGPAAVAV